MTKFFSLPQGDKPLKQGGGYPLSTTLRAPQTLGLTAKPLRKIRMEGGSPWQAVDLHRN